MIIQFPKVEPSFSLFVKFKKLYFLVESIFSLCLRVQLFIPYCLLGVESARLVSQKAKGMPRIVVTLTKMAESSASEAMATLSLELFRSFKRKQHLQGICIFFIS